VALKAGALSGKSAGSPQGLHLNHDSVLYTCTNIEIKKNGCLAFEQILKVFERPRMNQTSIFWDKTLNKCPICSKFAGRLTRFRHSQDL
jgi:hypothetical protein